MLIKEFYSVKDIAANGTFAFVGIIGIAGILAKTAGTFAVTTGGVTPITGQPVTAGQYVPCPVAAAGNNITVTFAGGGSGAVFYA